jgi:hypothetical protein
MSDHNTADLTERELIELEAKRKFKDHMLQKTYILAREQYGQYGQSIPPSVLGNAYRLGRDGLESIWPRGTMAHAAWAAGRDDWAR